MSNIVRHLPDIPAIKTPTSKRCAVNLKPIDDTPDPFYITRGT